MLLCFPLVNELLLYIYLSQLMSTLTKLSKSVLSSRWFLLPESQETVIQQSHMYSLIHWLGIQEYIGEITFQLSFVHTCYFPVIWAYPNVNQHFSSKSRSEYLSVCLSCFDLDFNILPVDFIFRFFCWSFFFTYFFLVPD